MKKESNSLLEQLQRDAKKTGAFQAKIAYAEYLLANPSAADPVIPAIKINLTI